ncbi:hypothetical protein [Sphingobacterium rhinopitheci]|uniref:hypothetical protein n=1 Tax=Sphingobacterium rhinopitheci TaxID=2781960 RepID=UPI001F523F64|nr:hypothetical protein [Sphingobacterium rhinopitheci]MCI0921710.1 hypothetical protein [Sphingobacterium rhinopitheci]
MKKFPLFLIVLSIVSCFFACVRDDDEPTVTSKAISRLYVSTSDYDGSSGNNYNNVFVISPADSSVFPPANIDSIYAFTSSARGGRFIHYTPFSNGLIFQGSQNSPVYIDTAVQMMTVSNTGVLRNTGKLGNRNFNNVKGLGYTIVNSGTLSENFLLMLNADSLSVIDKPTSKGSSRIVNPRFHMLLDYNPWGINISERDVFVSSFANVNKPSATNGIVVYKNLTSKFVENRADSILKDYARFDLTIAGAKNVRGLSYSKANDILVVTDYEGEGNSSKGRVMIFTKFSQYTSSGIITPDRIITSAGLKQPLDVAIDTRVDGKFIYVADPIAKLVFRFLITDEGDVTPNQQINLFGRSPVSLSLDSRAPTVF